MSLLDRIGRRVGPKTKLLGRECFDRKGVRILFEYEEFVSAQVTADPPGTVDLENDRGELVYSCDCARFEHHLALCEHVWATLLELERRNHFEQWPPSFPAALAPAVFTGTHLMAASLTWTRISKTTTTGKPATSPGMTPPGAPASPLTTRTRTTGGAPTAARRGGAACSRS